MTINFKLAAQLLFGVFLSLCLSVTFMMVASPAFAATIATVTPTSDPVVLNLTPTQVSGLIGSLIPILVSLLARSGASDKVKMFLNLALTAVTTALVTLVTKDSSGETYNLVGFLTAWLFAFVSSVVAYIGVLKNLDVNDFLLNFGGLFGQRHAPEIEATPNLPLDVDPTTEAQILDEVDKLGEGQ